jgi:hypothetical protein
MVACGWKCAGISEHGGERRGAADGCVQSRQRQLGPNVGGAAAAKAGSWRVDLGAGPLKHRPTFRKAPDRGFRITRFPFFLSEGEEQAARPCGRHRGLLGVTIQASQTFSPARILGLLRWSRLGRFPRVAVFPRRRLRNALATDCFDLLSHDTFHSVVVPTSRAL